MPTLATALAIAVSVGPPPQAGPAPARATAEILMDVVGTPTGGLRQKAVGVFVARGTLVLDAELAMGIRGLSLSGSVLATAGGQPSDFVGDLQGVSNTAAPNGVRPYEIWVQQNLVDRRISVLAGLYDVNSEFDVLHSAALFINSSFGIGPDLGLSGPNGPSVFPAPGLALRLAALPLDQLRVRVVLADGTPGSRRNPQAFDPSWGSGDGSLVIGEAAYLLGRADASATATPQPEPRHVIGRLAEPHDRGKVGAGLWRYQGYGSGFPDWGWGGYVLAERRFPAPHPGSPALALFARAGFNTAADSPVRRYVGGGFTLHGHSAPSVGSTFGLGLALASPRHEQFLAPGEPRPSDRTEIVLESTVQTPLGGAFYAQPSVQVVMNPAGAPLATNAWVVTLRVGLVP